jgi:sec-independent protein translocase protein TatC
VALFSFFNRNPNNDKGEMSFMDHLEALRWHVVRALLAIIVASLIAFLNINFIFDKIILGPTENDFISYRILCWMGDKLHTPALCLDQIKLEFQNTVLSGQFMMSITSSFVFGFIIAFPYVFWEFWRFVRPALSDKERKFTRGVVFWASLLFFVGVGFGYLLLAPYTVNFFATYSISDKFRNIITMENYLDTVIDLVLGAGVVFELPVVVYFLSKAGILTPKYMQEYRKFAWVIILFIAAIITPPDMFSMIFVSIPLLILYEVSIVLSGRILKEKQNTAKEFWDN